jgi:signal transduction histidine kinase/putative methionine-R-sulfoxide reductase with GAF domain
VLHHRWTAGARPCSSGGVTSQDPTASLEQRVRTLEAALAREERTAAALRDVGKALGTTLDLDDLLELILGRLTDVLDADRSTLYLLDSAKGELVSRIVIGGQVRSIRVRVGHGIAGTVAKAGHVIRLDDAYRDPRFEPEWDLFTGYRTKSMLAAPLKNHMGRTIGVIQVLNKKVGDVFTAEDEAMLGALSTQAAVAIDNTRLFLSLIQKNHQLLSTKDKLERRVTDLQLLNELESAMARAVSVDEIVKAALSALTRACQAYGSTILLLSEESGELVQYVWRTDQADGLSTVATKLGEGLASFVFQSNAALELADSTTHAHYSPAVDAIATPEPRACLFLPLEGGAEPMGSLGLFAQRGVRTFEEEDRSLIALVASNLSTAVRLFRASEQRERSQRLTTIGRLLSQVVHDFKTPMTVINGRVQLMVAASDVAVRREHADAIFKQFGMLTSMQREVLEFARGERRIFVRKVILVHFFNDLAEHVRLEIGQRPIELVLDVDNKAKARFDETRIARALQNLTRNAIEAMEKQGGVLRISARIVDEDLVIQVSDTGPGVPEEIRGRVFQSFVTAGKQGGTGLGLAIVKKIVEEHRGSIELRSSDRGATFELRLPQRAEVQSLLPPAPDGDDAMGTE